MYDIDNEPIINNEPILDISKIGKYLTVLQRHCDCNYDACNTLIGTTKNETVITILKYFGSLSSDEYRNTISMLIDIALEFDGEIRLYDIPKVYLDEIQDHILRNNKNVFTDDIVLLISKIYIRSRY